MQHSNTEFQNKPEFLQNHTTTKKINNTDLKFYLRHNQKFRKLSFDIVLT